MSKAKATTKPIKIVLNPYLWIIPISVGALIYLGYLSYINLRPATIEITPGEPRELPQQPCPSLVYSKTGKGYQREFYNRVEYIGDAPLYLVKEEVLKSFKVSLDCPVYPPNIAPNHLRTDVFVYPIEITGRIEPENSKIVVGESFDLVFRAEVKNKFSNSTWAFDLIPNKRDYLEFNLHALNFEFDPTKENTVPVIITNSLPAEHRWIIAPVEKANGRQSLNVEIKGQKFQGNVNVKLEVRQILGINPYVLAFSSLITTVISQVISWVAQIVTIRKDLRSGESESKSKENKNE